MGITQAYGPATTINPKARHDRHDMQKAAKRRLKHGLSRRNLPPFTSQKTANRNAEGL